MNQLYEIIRKYKLLIIAVILGSAILSALQSQGKKFEVQVMINGNLDNAVFSQEELPVKRGEVVTLAVGGDVFHRSMVNEGILKAEEVIAFQIPGDVKWYRITDETSFLVQKDGKVNFSLMKATLEPMMKYASVERESPKKLRVAPITVSGSVTSERKFIGKGGEFSKLKPVGTFQEQTLPDALRVEELPRDFDLREFAGRGFIQFENELKIKTGVVDLEDRR